MQRTSKNARGLEGRCLIERVSGETTDISEYLDFGFYDWCWYHDNDGLSPPLLGIWIGVSHRFGSDMYYWLLTKKELVIYRMTFQRVTNLELQTIDVNTECDHFDADISRRLKYDDFPLEGSKPNPEDWSEFINHDSYFQEEFDRIFSSEDIMEADETFTPDTYDDTYLLMELELPINGDQPEFARVAKRLKDANRLTIGTANQNPILDTIM